MILKELLFILDNGKIIQRLIPGMSLENKTVIISGATRGIGRAVVIELAKEGANISFNFLKSKQDAESLEEEIKIFGSNVKPFQVDIIDHEAGKLWVDETKDAAEVDVTMLTPQAENRQ